VGDFLYICVMKRIWTKETLLVEAIKYQTKIDFKNGNPRAYSAACNYKLIDEITKHMKPLGGLYKRIVYVYEFSDNHVYVGLTNNKDKRHNSHMDLVKLDSPVAKHMNKTGLVPTYKVLTDYIPAENAQSMEQDLIDTYKLNKWILLNTNKAGGLGKLPNNLTKDGAIVIAKKYNTRSDFKKYDHSVYVQCQKKGWFNEVISHIPLKDTTKWTYEKVKEISKQYKNKGQLKKHNQSAYRSALNNGWINEFFN